MRGWAVIVEDQEVLYIWTELRSKAAEIADRECGRLGDWRLEPRVYESGGIKDQNLGNAGAKGLNT